MVWQWILIISVICDVWLDSMGSVNDEAASIDIALDAVPVDLIN